MRVLVTGGRGFIGFHLVESLLNDGISVRVLTRNSDLLPSKWKGSVEVMAGDFASADGLPAATAGCEAVFHLGAELRDTKKMWAVNVVGTKNLLEAAAKSGTRRFIYLSSVGVYGCGGTAKRVDENTVMNPGNPYEKSKAAGEAVALRFHSEAGMGVAIVRPATVYGEGRIPRDDSFLRWIRLIKAGRFMMLGSNYVSSYTYVGDVAASCRFVEQCGECLGGIVIVSEPVPLVKFVAEISRLLEMSPPRMLPRWPAQMAVRMFRYCGRYGTLYNCTSFSIEKLEQLGFKYAYGYSDGLRRTLDWYQNMGFL